MDWSLINPTARKPFLRNTLAYKNTWMYYMAIVTDPILRFNWIFYAIYAQDLQHSAMLSFLVAISEAIRRGMWILFRVENEHCANMTRFRASRDVPLPYNLQDYSPALEAGFPRQEQTPSVRQLKRISTAPSTRSGPAGFATGSEMSRTAGSLRFRTSESPLVRGFSKVGNIMHLAHAQDFERRRKDVGPEIDADSSDEEGDVHEMRMSKVHVDSADDAGSSKGKRRRSLDSDDQ